MSDNRYAEAIDIIVRVAITEEFVAWDDMAKWGDFPEIGEHDWHKIARAIDRRVEAVRPSEDEYVAAYNFLAGRAEDDA